MVDSGDKISSFANSYTLVGWAEMKRKLKKGRKFNFRNIYLRGFRLTNKPEHYRKLLSSCQRCGS